MIDGEPRPNPLLEFTDEEKQAIASIEEAVDAFQAETGRGCVMSEQELFDRLSIEAKGVYIRLRQLQPSEYGISIPQVGADDTAGRQLVDVASQSIVREGVEFHTEPQYLSPAVYEAFTTMAEAMHTDTGKSLIVESSYRSPAYQMSLLCHYLIENGYDVATTLRRVTLPDFSEHCSLDSTALDFITADGIPDDAGNPEDFEDTSEFDWLQVNASRFGFVLSYPRNNVHNMTYEPWHWRFVGVDAAGLDTPEQQFN
ncbi:M15 family metallopeptidase [Candidatus Saccharibacteria bacterium]|nr:M15 family metallopeptidase [Candidatus Saccharibacteria bacterium]